MSSYKGGRKIKFLLGKCEYNVRQSLLLDEIMGDASHKMDEKYVHIIMLY